jgi:hypothetical protein
VLSQRCLYAMAVDYQHPIALAPFSILHSQFSILKVHVPDLVTTPLDPPPDPDDDEATARWADAVRWAVCEADPQLAGPRGLYWMAEAQLLRQRAVEVGA